MESVAVASIIVENRFRKELGDIEKLMKSISEVGLLQPIGVDALRRLVFGGRRLEAVKRLGWTLVPVKIVDCDALIAEHDENEMREAFRASERVAIAEAISLNLAGRVGKSGNVSGFEIGDTRDIAAAKAGLGSGKTLHNT